MDKERMKSKAENIFEEVKGGVNEVISRIRELIKEGSARRLIIKNKEGETVFQTQLAFGVSGAALISAMAPVISAIGMFAMFLNDYQILVEKEVTDDEFEVDAEIIEVIDEDEAEAEEETTAEAEEEKEEQQEKTVGKKNQGPKRSKQITQGTQSLI